MERRTLVSLAAVVTVALGVTATVGAATDYIPVQGRLTTTAGAPLDGAHSLTFRLYDSSTGGTLLCEDTRVVQVEQGLFSSYFNGSDCELDGKSVYFAIEVGSDGEMTPRLYVDNAVYAWGLRPGASVQGSYGGAILHIENEATSGRGLRAYATATSGTNYGVVGASTSPDGFGGYFYNIDDGVGLRAKSEGAGGKDAIMAESESGDGVSGTATAATGRGIYADNTGGGIAAAARSNSTGNLYPTLYLVQENASGNFVVGASSYFGTRYWRVDRTGKGYFNGGTQTSGADFAERVDVVGSRDDYEPGDVLVISQAADRTVERAAQKFSTAVVGVYSTEPGVLAGAPDGVGELGGVPVAITGIVPCKVTAENGPIRRGDLLVTATRPGHAMRAGDHPAPGTVLGKAMQPLDGEYGVIEILVSLR